LECFTCFLDKSTDCFYIMARLDFRLPNQKSIYLYDARYISHINIKVWKSTLCDRRTSREKLKTNATISTKNNLHAKRFGPIPDMYEQCWNVFWNQVTRVRIFFIHLFIYLFCLIYNLQFLFFNRQVGLMTRCFSFRLCRLSVARLPSIFVVGTLSYASDVIRFVCRTVPFLVLLPIFLRSKL